MYNNITESEWKIMKVLWKKSPLTLKEVVSALKEETNWSNNTIRTLIVRLMEKGLIGADKSMGHFKYSPMVEKEHCQMKEAKGLLNTIFEGSMGMFMTTFAKQGNLSKDDKEKLLEIINRMDENKGD